MNNFLAHILVVDDDDGIRKLVKQFLNENNYLVTTAQSAEEAQSKIKIIEFDLIVLDVMMSGKSGLEFLVENKKSIDTPIILLTARGESDDRIIGFESGADDYLPKPFEPKELILRIKSILNRTKTKKPKHLAEFENIKIDLNKLFIFKNNKQHKINTPASIYPSPKSIVIGFFGILKSRRSNAFALKIILAPLKIYEIKIFFIRDNN